MSVFNLQLLVDTQAEMKTGKLPFLKVAISELTAEERKYMPIWTGPNHRSSPWWMKHHVEGRFPNHEECKKLAMAVKVQASSDAIPNKDVETAALSAGKSLRWDKDKLYVGDSATPHLMNVVPRTATVYPSVLSSAVLVSSMYAMKDGNLVHTFPPSNAKTGPFSTVTTESAVYRAETAAEALLKTIATTTPKSTETARLMVEKASQDTNYAAGLVHTYNTVLEKVKITIPTSGQVDTATGFGVLAAGTFKAGNHEYQRGCLNQATIGTYSVKHEKPDQAKTVFARLVSDRQSRVPSMMQKFAGFYGFPGKIQRHWMERMYLHEAYPAIVAIDPPTGMLGWYAAQARTERREFLSAYSLTGALTIQGHKMKPYDSFDLCYMSHTSGDTLVIPPALRDKTVLFEIANCDVERIAHANSGYVYGFFRKPWENRWIAIPKAMAANVPTAFGEKFVSCDTKLALHKVLGAMYNEAVVLAITGSTKPNRALYAALSYPTRYEIMDGDFSWKEQVDDDVIRDAIKQVAAPELTTSTKAVETISTLPPPNPPFYFFPGLELSGEGLFRFPKEQSDVFVKDGDGAWYRQVGTGDDAEYYLVVAMNDAQFIEQDGALGGLTVEPAKWNPADFKDDRDNWMTSSLVLQEGGEAPADT